MNKLSSDKTYQNFETGSLAAGKTTLFKQQTDLYIYMYARIWTYFTQLMKLQIDQIDKTFLSYTDNFAADIWVIMKNIPA